MTTSSPISREKRLAQVRAWRASGLSAAEFAPQVSTHPSTLAWWKWKLQSEGALRSPKPRGRSSLPFVEITPAPVRKSLPAGDRLELEVADVTLRVPNDFEERTLARVLQVLRSSR